MTQIVHALVALIFLSCLNVSAQGEDKPCNDLSVGITKLPLYPPIGLAAHFQGTIHMNLKISAEGEILSIESVEGPELLRGAAKDFVSNWEIGWHGQQTHHACIEKVIIDYKFVESTKSVSSFSYETVTEDGTSTTTVIGRPKYFKIVPMY